jgi:hypothetical protein
MGILKCGPLHKRRHPAETGGPYLSAGDMLAA